MMFEFDNITLTAGGFFAVLLWGSLGLALGIY
jgi:hypothetical protein